VKIEKVYTKYSAQELTTQSSPRIPVSQRNNCQRKFLRILAN